MKNIIHKAKKFLLLVCFFLLMISCSNQSQKEIESILGTTFSESKLDDFIETELKNLNISGISLCLINDGKLVYHTTKGFADRDKKIVVDSLSIFEGASISKSVFGYFIMTFVEDGILDLDKPLYQYYPYPDIEHDSRYKKITARMVLSHRAGFPNWRDDYNTNQLFLKFDPNTDYFYSGEGYQYLAIVIKHLLKTNWEGLEQEFQKRVAIPFEMIHTKFIQDDYIRMHKVKPYNKEGEPIDKSTMKWWIERDTIFVAPTTIHSEGVDFSKWMIAMMNEEGISKKNFDILFQTHSEISGNWFFKSDYALGFGKTTLFDKKILYSHNGNNTGFSSLFLFDKDKKWGLVYFTNSEVGDDFGIKLIYEFLLTGWSKLRQLSIVVFTILNLIITCLSLYILKRKKTNYTILLKKNLFVSIISWLSVVVLFITMLLEIFSIKLFIVFSCLIAFSLLLYYLKTSYRGFQLLKSNKNVDFNIFFQILVPITQMILITLILIF